MKKYYNTNERYGWCGPYEAESKEQLADEMIPCFEDWASDANCYVTVDEMREEFIAGLEEVE